MHTIHRQSLPRSLTRHPQTQLHSNQSAMNRVAWFGVIVVVGLVAAPKMAAAADAVASHHAASLVKSDSKKKPKPRKKPGKLGNYRPIHFAFEFRGGAVLPGDNTLIQGRSAAFDTGVQLNAGVGVEYHHWLQLLFVMQLGNPQLDTGTAQAFATPGRYGSGSLGVGFDARLLSKQRWGVQFFTGVGVRARLLTLGYTNPNATSASPRTVHRTGADSPADDVSQFYTGLSVAGQFGLRRTLVGVPGGSQLAFVAMIEPQWTRWAKGDTELRRDDDFGRAVNAAFETRAQSGSSLAWNVSAGFALVF